MTFSASRARAAFVHPGFDGGGAGAAVEQADGDNTMTLGPAAATPMARPAAATSATSACLQSLARDLLDGRTKAAALTQQALDRIAALEPRLHAFLHLNAARAQAHSQALTLALAGRQVAAIVGRWTG